MGGDGGPNPGEKGRFGGGGGGGGTGKKGPFGGGGGGGVTGEKSPFGGARGGGVTREKSPSWRAKGGRVKWRGARVADSDGLENRCPRKGTVGSNPTLSAIPSLLDPERLG